MKCKRCGEPEDRIHGCCSVYCSDMWEHEETIKKLQAENARLREALTEISHGPVGYWNDDKHAPQVVHFLVAIATKALQPPETD